ncbi:class III lanthionine synthetase LanKC N-terminal domain-containing protein [Nocardia tenerifensis]|nr:phosphotransferase [Nocardia tenerifensis]
MLDADLTGYEVVSEGYWTNLIPKLGPQIDIQGWKIHLSAAFGREQEVIKAAVDICSTQSMPFKYVSSIPQYRLYNSKHANRSTAGKLVTIYPRIDLLEQTLRRLDDHLRHIEGPHILSDVRWSNGPVFVRFGAFKRMEHDGKFCVLRPDGSWDEDRRQPWFILPDWVTVPDFLKPAVDRKELYDVPFNVESVIRQSNAGGVYSAYMIATGEEVVVKEGRRHAGYTRDAADGHARIRHEAEVLRRLAGAEATPRVVWEGDVGGHYMVALSKMVGMTLERWIVLNMPLYSSLPKDWQEYASRCNQIVNRLIDAVAGINAADVVHGDIHPQNILVDPSNLSIAIIDFETATSLVGMLTRAINAPGYTVPDEIETSHADRYAITKLITDMLTARVEHEDITDERYNWALPVLLEQISAKNGSAPAAMLQMIETRRRILVDIGLHEKSDIEPPVANFIAKLRADMPAVMAASQSRFGHLPVHYSVFEDELSGVGLGFAGHAIALYPERDESLIIGITNEAQRSTRVGMFDGLCGSVYGLLRLGAETDAVALIDGVDLLGSAPSMRVFDGAAGILIAALKAEAYGAVVKKISSNLQRDIGEVARQYLAATGMDHKVRSIRTNRFVLQNSGLMYGDLGLAWLFAEAYIRFGSTLFIDAMNHALMSELRSYEFTPGGGLQFEDNGRLLPYLATGSAGFGVVLHDIPADLVNPAVSAVIPDLITACAPTFSASCGLFNGYSGLFYGRNGLKKFMGADLAPLADLDTSVRAMAVYTSFEAWAVPSDENFRVTTDFATGASGIIHVANMVRSGYYGLLQPLQT